MTKMQVLTWTMVAAFNNFSLAQQLAFRTWFEAPKTVMAGQTFEVSLRASFEVDGAPAAGGLDAGWISSVAASVQVAGDLESFESLSAFQGLAENFLSVGSIDGSWLHDFLFLQIPSDLWPWPFPGPTVGDFSNPLSIGTFEVSTSKQLGTLELHLQPFSGLDDPSVAWWQVSQGEPIDSTSPGVSLFAQPATIHVIPSPASLALLAPLAIMSSRRRRG